jgi:hypothetical protein
MTYSAPTDALSIGEPNERRASRGRGRPELDIRELRSELRRGLSELPAGHRTVGEQRSHLVETHPQHSGLTPERTNILAVVRGQQQPRIGPAKPFDHQRGEQLVDRFRDPC